VSLDSVRRGVNEFLARFPQLHVLINNAGTGMLTRQLSVDGIELTFAMNYLGHFLLTQLLLERVRTSAPARIVNLAGMYHKRGPLCLDDLQFERCPYHCL